MLTLNPRYRFAAIVLAAGQSRRMGGEQKLLKPWRGRPLLAHSLATLAALRPLHTIVVLGRDARPVQTVPELDAVTTVFNDQADTGMASSIVAGCRALNDAVDAVFLCLGDMPLIPPDVFHTLADAFDPQSGTTVCVPLFEGRSGHPVLFGRACLPELLALRGDVGARSVIRNRSDQTRRVTVNQAGILQDFDEPADFQQ